MCALKQLLFRDTESTMATAMDSDTQVIIAAIQ
jgi:hypothetical protein